MVWARLWGLVVLASALDLSTSLCLHGADRQASLPERPAWLLGVQLALLPWLGLYAARPWPVLRRAFAELPISQLGKLTIGLLVAVQLGHVCFRTEHYPFSAVTMFSDYVPEDRAPVQLTHLVFIVDGEHGPRPISFLREGNPYFSEYLTIDYKTGWLLGTFGQSGARSTARVAGMLRRAGGRNPRLARVQLDAHDGTLRVLSENMPTVDSSPRTP
ncbi:MAG: hypothetical protein RLZZ450_427 [Pseudomonadota bacterium]|jgi:hypothetical protein